MNGPFSHADHVDAMSSLIGVVGAPRSGTTVITAALSVHSRVASIYEPWNANQSRIDAGRAMSFDNFLDNFAARTEPRPVLLVKETATDLRYLQRMDDLLSDPPPSVVSHLVVAFRNPFHVYLSEMQARREWWGEEGLEVGEGSFTRWASRMLMSCRMMAEMARRHDAVLLSYEAFSRNPIILERLTRMVGLEFEPHQAMFEQHVNRTIVRGDNRVAKEPRAISPRSTEFRRTEFQDMVARFSTAPAYQQIARLQKIVGALPPITVASAHADALGVMTNL